MEKKILKKSGNFVIPEKWEPWLYFWDQLVQFDLTKNLLCVALTDEEL